MGTRRISAYAATIGTVILFALSGASQALAAPAASAPNEEQQAAAICSPNGTLVVTRDTSGRPTAITCTIDQTAATPGANNQAVCIERTSAPDAVETCVITQDNTTGSNRAVVLQDIHQNDGPTQFGRQRTTITQSNVSGSNAAGVDQNLSQSTDGAGTQSQESDQGFRGTFDPGVTIQQENTTGMNLIGLNQMAKQFEKTHDGTVLQQQMARQSSHLDQHHTPVTLGRSRAVINQDVDQTQQGPNHLNQAQVADPHCCNFFEGSQVRVDLRQDINQHAMSGAQQSATNQARCIVTPSTAGTCNVVETINQNGATITTTCSSSFCDIGQQCTDHTCAPCPGGEGTVCPTPPCIINCGAAPNPTGASLSSRLGSAANVRMTRSLRAVTLLTT